MDKKVSVIIPCYNSGEYIVKCLDSIPKRDDIEIICINDGSEDNTLKALKEYKNLYYNDLIIINYKDRKGVSYARNRGLNKATGDYILTIDSDDTIDGNVFNEIIEEELNGFIDMVFYNMIDNNGQVYDVNPHSVMNRVGCFKFVRREFIGKTRYKVGLQRGEDSVFHTQLVCKSPNIRCTDKLMYYYNYPREGSLTDIYKKTKVDKLQG